MSMSNSNDTIGNRTRDLPACSAVPQPNAPLCTAFKPYIRPKLFVTDAIDMFEECLSKTDVLYRQKIKKKM